MHQFQDRRSAHRIPVRVVEAYNNHTPVAAAVADGPVNPKPAAAEPAVDWEALARRQQADMDNFRKRQTRRAEEAIAVERERLLRLVLPVIDNLARALNHHPGQAEPLRQGIELTRRELERMLAAEGVSRIETVGRPFDPQWHEALATVSAPAEANTIIEEIEAGYTLGEKLLRPAKVIVAA